MTYGKVKVKVTMPATQKVSGPDRCPRCGGVGYAVRRVHRRRNGSVSSITFDLNTDCPDCHGTGAKP